jgi:type VI secretion system lysozyme-like protein
MIYLFERLMSNDTSGMGDVSALDYLGRDIENLLNHTRLPATTDNDNHLSRCVLNYGLPSLAGSRIDGSTIPRIASQIETALIRFEPRLDSQSIVVQSSSEAGERQGTLMFTVKGCLRQRQEKLRLQLSFDVHFGRASVVAEMSS